ncbi:MAG: adenosine deaminase, partial [Bacteroidetes bacterium]|nr:adenosine deaminase [Bacteroidota bacterium]
ENYLAVAKALNLSQEQILQLAKNSFKASWLSDEEKIKEYTILESHKLNT